MSAASISVHDISKVYTIGGPGTGYRTFRETVMESVRGVASLPSRILGRSSAKTNTTSEYFALKNVSFEVEPGEVVGIIGRNGAGKSTLLKVLSRITEPTTGYADIHGRVGSLLEVGTGFHPELTGRENIFLNGAVLGMSRNDIERQFDEIVAFSEVEKFIDTPVKFYSSGMYLRLAFAVAAHLEPEILLVDEVLAVGDLQFQKKCLGKMGDVAKQGRTILFVSHNMGAVRALCTKGVVLDKGTVVEQGHIGKAIETYYKLAATAQESGEKADRTGFGHVKLVSHPGSSIEQGDGFELATTLNLKQEVAGFTMLCLLEDMNQRPILHLRKESTEIRNGAWFGSHELHLKLPPLWLEPGLYTLHFKVLLWGQLAQARYLSEYFHLDVGGNSSGWGAALTPRADWRFNMKEDAK
ncbi:MAG: ABC transporter ATP-binding protein [Bryobacteraceae bacterium]